MPETAQEQKLIERAKSDGEAFGQLYDLYYPKIFNYTLRRTADFATAEDVTAEVFIKVLDQIHRFKWRGAIACFAGGFLVYAGLKHKRRH